MFNAVVNHVQEKKRPYTVIVLMLLIMGSVSVLGNTFEQKELAVDTAIKAEQLAQVGKSYVPLAPLPGQESVGTANTVGYLQNLIFLGIGLAIVLAVLMIVIGGIRYMASDAFTEKKEAINQMTMALVGLIIALGGYLLLETINPDLVTFRLPSGIGVNINTPTHQEIQEVQQQIQQTLPKGGGRIRDESGVSMVEFKVFPSDSKAFKEGKLFELQMGVLTLDKNATRAAAAKQCAEMGKDNYELISKTVGTFGSGELLTCQKK